MKLTKTFIAGFAALTTAASAAFTAYASAGWTDASLRDKDTWNDWKNTWEITGNDYEKIALTPGSFESELNLAWYSHTEEAPAVRVSKNCDMTDCIESTGTQKAVDTAYARGYFSNKVIVSGLESNTKYYYQVLKNGEWTKPAEYTTADPKAYNVLYVSDPQIGASRGSINSEGVETDRFQAAANDSFNWSCTLNAAMEKAGSFAFILSAGDQINYSPDEFEYAGYLAPPLMSSLPSATAIGTHDYDSKNYTYHFNNPNADYFESGDFLQGKTSAGTDYWFTYGDVSYVVLDANNMNCATHRAALEKAAEDAPEAKWRVVMIHNDIYGTGYLHSNTDGMTLRTQLTPMFDEFDIDMVLTGHDHVYSRSYQLTSDGKPHKAFTSAAPLDFYAENQCYTLKSTDDDGNYLIDPEGTVYFEVNSASGSKFYDLAAEKQDYIAERGQTLSPSYAIISFSETKAEITFYDALTGEILEHSTPYTIVKTADKTALEKAVEETAPEAEKRGYTEDSMKRLKDAVKAAKDVMDDPEADSEMIAAAEKELRDSLTALEKPKATTTSKTTVKTTTAPKTTKAAAKTTAKTDSPKTGDAGVGAAVILGLVTAVAAAFLVRENHR